MTKKGRKRDRKRDESQPEPDIAGVIMRLNAGVEETINFLRVIVGMHTMSTVSGMCQECGQKSPCRTLALALKFGGELRMLLLPEPEPSVAASNAYIGRHGRD